MARPLISTRVQRLRAWAAGGHPGRSRNRSSGADGEAVSALADKSAFHRGSLGFSARAG